MKAECVVICPNVLREHANGDLYRARRFCEIARLVLRFRKLGHSVGNKAFVFFCLGASEDVNHARTGVANRTEEKRGGLSTRQTGAVHPCFRFSYFVVVHVV